MRSASLQINVMPTLKELAQLGKEALLTFVAQLLTEFAALNARVEKLLAENAALKAQLDQQARDAKRQAAPFSRGRRKARPKPPPSPGAAASPAQTPGDVSQARAASPSAPCRLPASGPPPRSRSGCPS